MPRHDDGILRMPDLDVRKLFGIGAACRDAPRLPRRIERRRLGVPRRDADEDERAIVGPLRDAEADHAKVGGKTVLRRIQLARGAGGGDILPDEHV